MFGSKLRIKTLFTLAAGMLLISGAAQQASAVNIITNGSFEAGFTGWGTKDIAPPFFPLAVRGAGITPGFGLFATAPTDGASVASHGFDGGGPGTIEIFQDLVISASSTATLTFDWRAGWDFFACGTCTGVRMLDLVVQPSGGGGALFTTSILTADPLVTAMLLDTGAGIARNPSNN